MQKSSSKKYGLGLYAMAALYVIAGVYHFINPDFYLKIIPLWLPWHLLLVSLSGLAEILLGILLIPVQTRRFSAWLIIAMLVVFLVTIHVPMAIDHIRINEAITWLIWFRIPVQFVLIAWAYFYAKKNEH